MSCRWIWILQDLLGIAFCLNFMKTISLSNFKVFFFLYNEYLHCSCSIYTNIYLFIFINTSCKNVRQCSIPKNFCFFPVFDI